MDEVDSANAHAERYLAQALEAQRERARAEASPPPSTECLWCGDELDTPRVFCDLTCSRMWDKAQRLRMIDGDVDD